MCSLAFRISAPNGPWITVLGLLVVVALVAIGVWIHRRDWAEMRRARKARRERHRKPTRGDPG